MSSLEVMAGPLYHLSIKINTSSVSGSIIYWMPNDSVSEEVTILYYHSFFLYSQGYASLWLDEVQNLLKNTFNCIHCIN